MKKSILILLLLSIFIGCKVTNNGNNQTDSKCVNEDNLAKENTCLTATVLEQGNPFPNPVQIGGTVMLKMKIGAVGSQTPGSPLNIIPATISSKMFSVSTGQLISQQNVGTVQSLSTYQNVPIWNNINVATGTYYLEVTVSVGSCGNKKICLSNKKIVVIK